MVQSPIPQTPSMNSVKAPVEQDPDFVNKFLLFNDESKSPYHATECIARMLRQEGFKCITEREDWAETVKPGDRCFFTRDGSSIIAFAIDSEVSNSSQQTGFSIIGAHTDSPCFKVKPVSKKTAHGYLQLGVECYGGGLWHTWFDRDLTVAGRVIVKTGEKQHCMRLVSIPRPILRIPNLAIHLSRNVNIDGFKVNKETDTTPILATELAAALNKPNGTAQSETKKNGGGAERHHALLIEALAKELDVSPCDIVDLDLCLSDTQPSAIGGLLDEFVFAPRLDNLASCYTATQALISSLKEGKVETSGPMIRMVACFDHEEIGSRSSHGADSPLLMESLKRLCRALEIDYDQALPHSLMISADMAHGIHPNYASKHEANHRPGLGNGLVIKTNQNQRYATSGVSGFIVREAARRAGNLSIQEFVVPNDKPCGSTIGPISSSRSGLRTVDVGQAQLSMHSVREMCSVKDFYLSEEVMRTLLSGHREIVDELDGQEVTM